MWNYFVVTLIFGSLASPIRCDLYASVSEMEGLIDTEHNFINDLTDFLEKQSLYISFLKLKLQEFSEDHEMALNDTERYLSVPLNSFRLIKRLSMDMKKLIENSLAHSSEFQNKINKYSEKFATASESDLVGTIMGIHRLQRMYELSTEDLSNGVILGTKYSASLSVEDCFQIGKYLFEYHEYEAAIGWLEAAVSKSAQTNQFEVSEIECLELLGTAYNETGNLKSTYKTVMKIQRIDPNNVIAMNLESSIKRTINDKQFELDNQLYEKACRGNLKLSVENLSKLKCFYVDNTTMFTKLARIKAEEAHMDPRIIIFHDVLYDSEIAILKNLSRLWMFRSTISGSEGNEVSEVRVSKVWWIAEDEHEIISVLSRRVEDMTGLSMETSEEFQTQTYGIGGHYSYHTDYLGNLKNISLGDRLATVLFYMSDVESGGSTVFPYLKVKVNPVKGTAVYWHNLHHSGGGDMRTIHAACPVIVGQKWAVNKWILENGQMFRYPCHRDYTQPAGLDYYHHYFN